MLKSDYFLEKTDKTVKTFKEIFPKSNVYDWEDSDVISRIRRVTTSLFKVECKEQSTLIELDNTEMKFKKTKEVAKSKLERGLSFKDVVDLVYIPEFALPGNEFKVLTFIKLHKQVNSATLISEHLDLTKRTVNQVLKKLHKAGMIEKTKNGQLNVITYKEQINGH